MKDYNAPNFEILLLREDIITTSGIITNVNGENVGNDCYDDGWLN